MIVAMSKIYVVARKADRDRLLAALRDLGVVHLKPVDAARAVADAETTAALDRFGRAIQILEGTPAEGEAPEISPADAADDVLGIQRNAAERTARLTALYRQLEQLAPWGDVRLEQFAALREAGIDLAFFALPPADLGAIQAECVDPIAPWHGKRVLVAVIRRGGEAEMPDSAEPVPLPARDRPSIRAEAKEVDAALKADAARLAALAHLVGALHRERARLKEQVEWTVATRSALDDERLYALQGWVPEEKVAALASDLAGAGVEAGVETAPIADDDEPPTLIKYPRWARPIKGLFDILGTLPGYREMDLSAFFMVALPLFAAMLIGDAGYGLIISLAAVVFYRKLVTKAGQAKTRLLLIIGVATLIWGVLSANYFGVTPATLAEAGGFTRETGDKVVADYDALRQGTGVWAATGRMMMAPALTWDEDPKTARYLLMKIAFVIGAVHLILAHVRKAFAYMPDQRFLAEVGWCVILADMLVGIWHLVFIGVSETPVSRWIIMGIIIGAGLLLPIGFSHPRAGVLKRVLIGFAGSLLPLLGTFSDTMSYVRLMAVGLASYYIAAAFNTLAASLAEAVTWYGVLPIIVLLFGHALNMGLAAIAIFAHGVRLNMLEFSTNAGVQWAGYAYAPFATARNDKE